MINGLCDAQQKLPIMPRNWRLGGIPETETPKKDKVDDGIAFKPVTKPGTDPEVVLERTLTLTRKNKQN